MTYTDITKQFNILLAGDNLPMREVLPHCDFAIDKINEALNTTYPTLTEYYTDEETGEHRTAYDLFDNRYIRQVVLKGAAWHYYVTDEEGMSTAPQYQQDFENALFMMQRDTLYNIPLEYRANYEQGTVRVARDHWNLGERGLTAMDPNLI